MRQHDTMVTKMAVQTEIKAVLDSLKEPRLLIRHDFSVAYANRAFLCRYGHQDYEGRPCYEVVFHQGQKCSACGEVCPLEQSMVSKSSEEAYRRQVTMSGPRFVELNVVPISRADGEAQYFMETVRDTEGLGELLQRGGLISNSLAVRKLLPKIAQLVPLDIPVLLKGETGSGKEIFAKVLHENSRRAAQGFLHLECLTLSEEKLAREINRTFGMGLTGGTLYLSDVAELSAAMQANLLYLLKTGRYFTDGDTAGEKADIRVIFGTKYDLRDRVDQGLFNEELYYMLSITRLDVPSLRQRPEDLPELCEMILKETPSGRQLSLSNEALAILASRQWRGNVSELQAVLHRASIFCKHDQISVSDVQRAISFVCTQVDTSEIPLSKRLQDDQSFKELLSTWKGSREELAKALGISVRTLYRQIRKLDNK